VDINKINNLEITVHDWMIMKSRLHLSNTSSRDRGNRMSQYHSKNEKRTASRPLSSGGSKNHPAQQNSSGMAGLLSGGTGGEDFRRRRQLVKRFMLAKNLTVTK
jgi:hypothetical protein